MDSFVEDYMSVEADLRAMLEDAVTTARRAVTELAGPDGIGEYAGHECEAPYTVTHFFGAHQPGYRGWRWACVLAAVPGEGQVTVDEISLLPGPDALVAPEWVPWEKRLRPGDLGAGDLLPPAVDDERLVPADWLSGDDEVDEWEDPEHAGRPNHLSPEGRAAAAERWSAERGPDSAIARGAEHTCDTCGFLVPLAGSLGTMFGVCANEYSADGRVVQLSYGCGAHSEVVVPPVTEPAPEAFDDAAVEVVVLPGRDLVAAGETAQA